eukprot:5969605-Ditylum_brightwellii.AAC.1
MSPNEKVPRHNHFQRPTTNKNKPIGSYADALKKEYTDKSSYLQNIYSQKFDQTPLGRPNKRVMVNTEINLTKEEEKKQEDPETNKVYTQDSEMYEHTE